MDVVIVSTNDKYYLGRDRTGRYIKRTSISQADVHESMLKANNVIKNCLTKTEQNKWVAKYIDDINKVKEKQKITINNNQNINIDNFDFEKCLDDIITIVEKCEEQRKILCKQLSNVDLEISDIEHFIQTEKINVCKWVKIFKIFSEKRNERALIKQKQRKINILIDNLNQSFDKSSIGLIKAKLEEVEYNTYNPRTEMWNTLLEL
ncbi:hypothetical protein [Anaerovorax sp. IOR16]|uniref:hypothetical protein n=1 Tax=Anaerovorax sp. IOR16 TaxID=2773458 RepID=UPI0019D14A49|nr:hypothetical protein [Anaerovorax sp. IOR16]